jgi:hypothetical protein
MAAEGPAMGFGDVKVAEARGYKRAHDVILKACAQAFADDDNCANCSGFVKAVADMVGVPLAKTGKGQANDIYLEIQKPPWIPIGTGEAASVRAVYYAREGFLVVAAWKNPDANKNGHVAIVTDLRDLTKLTKVVTDVNVAASWGVLDRAELARQDGRVRDAFGPDKRPAVFYAAQYIRKWS